MLPFDLPEFDDHEQVCVGRDRDAGLFGVVAIHSTARGPALGDAGWCPINPALMPTLMPCGYPKR